MQKYAKVTYEKKVSKTKLIEVRYSTFKEANIYPLAFQILIRSLYARW